MLLNIWFIAPLCFFMFSQDLAIFNKELTIGNFFNLLISANDFLSLGIRMHEIIVNIGPLVYFGIAVLVFVFLKRNMELSDMGIPGRAMVLMALVFAVMCTDIIPWEGLIGIKIVETLILNIQFAFRFYGLFLMALCLALTFKGKCKDLHFACVVLCLVIAAGSAFEMYYGVILTNGTDNSILTHLLSI